MKNYNKNNIKLKFYKNFFAVPNLANNRKKTELKFSKSKKIILGIAILTKMW